MSHFGMRYLFGPFEMDPGECQLRCGPDAVPLTTKAFDLLAILIEQHGHLIYKDELLQRIWGDVCVEEAVLSVNIATIRRALGENGRQYIETVPKRGYRFIASVQVLDSAKN
jgi:DNA-binding winged-HTH domains